MGWLAMSIDMDKEVRTRSGLEIEIRQQRREYTMMGALSILFDLRHVPPQLRQLAIAFMRPCHCCRPVTNLKDMYFGNNLLQEETLQ